MKGKKKKDNKVTREESLFDKRLEKKPKTKSGFSEKIILAILAIIIAAVGVFAGKYGYNLLAGEDDTTTTTTTISTTTVTTTMPQSTTTTTTKSQEVTITSDLGLNMRESTDTDSEILEIIPFEETVPVIDQQGDWYQVEYNDQTGWISSEYTK